MTTKAKETPPAEEPTGITTADVAALNPAPDPEPAAEAAPFMSEGMRVDLEIHGHAVDPNTGKKITKE
jgi:hypothetical protein